MYDSVLFGGPKKGPQFRELPTCIVSKEPKLANSSALRQLFALSLCRGPVPQTTTSVGVGGPEGGA